ncbi:MAG: hypothetical protein NW223_15680 [Hyphomicrobiaceae bacterium]|nr:hypothetical protein [Hyphomicrobiaceae bacterium]
MKIAIVRARALRRCLGVAVAMALCGLPAHAQQAPRIDTNEAHLREVLRPPLVDVADTMSVFALVFAALPSRVEVLPTENYYYFRFIAGGVPWAGSIRLGPVERAAGKLEFGFYKDLAAWADEMQGARREILGSEHGVSVAAEAPLAYRVTYRDRSVLFALNDLSSVSPPVHLLLPQEKFIGPIFDESGLRFFLLYNRSAKVFHYVLDETVPVADELMALAASPRIAIGRRTGFAFYRDQLRERRILIGVHEASSRLNTYLDGPFDQLPENFIAGEDLRAAILDADPGAKGEIDRLGNYLREEGRYLIHPYMLYRRTADLVRIDACASGRLKRPDLYARCFEIAPDPTTLRPPPAKAARK